MLQNLSSATVVIGALRVKPFNTQYLIIRYRRNNVNPDLMLKECGISSGSELFTYH